MKTQAKLVQIVNLVPFAFATGLSLWASMIGGQSPSFASQLMLTTIPCGLLGMSASLNIVLIRTCEKRIAQLEQRIEEGWQPEESPHAR